MERRLQVFNEQIVDQLKLFNLSDKNGSYDVELQKEITKSIIDDLVSELDELCNPYGNTHYFTYRPWPNKVSINMSYGLKFMLFYCFGEDKIRENFNGMITLCFKNIDNITNYDEIFKTRDIVKIRTSWDASSDDKKWYIVIKNQNSNSVIIKDIHDSESKMTSIDAKTLLLFNPEYFIRYMHKLPGTFKSQKDVRCSDTDKLIIDDIVNDFKEYTSQKSTKYKAYYFFDGYTKVDIKPRLAVLFGIINRNSLKTILINHCSIMSKMSDSELERHPLIDMAPCFSDNYNSLLLRVPTEDGIKIYAVDSINKSKRLFSIYNPTDIYDNKCMPQSQILRYNPNLLPYYLKSN